MACYSNACKHRSSKCVFFVGGILIIMGLVTAVVGFLLTGDEDIQKVLENEWIKKMNIKGMDATSGFSTAIIIGGAFAVITGFLGLATGKFKKFCFTLPFMILSFLIGLLLVISGLIALAVLADKSELEEIFCNTTSE